jgi:zinc protease
MMRSLYIILLFLLVDASAFAVPKIESWRTENGAQVMFIEAHELPIVDVRIVFSAGAARDGGKPGLATLSNSLLMSGAGDMDADAIALRLESVGAAASTESLRDMAIVSMRSLSERDKLRTMTEVMRAVLTQPTFPAADLERERKQLLATLEYKKQQPEEVAEEAFYKLVYGAHPYGSPAQGTPESVSAITREQIGDFYHRYYVARNAVVAVVGDIKESGARQLVKDLIGALPAGEAAAPVPEVVPLTQALRQHIGMPTVQTHILVGQPGVTRDDPDYFPLYVGNHILGGSGFESRLMDDIREKRGLAYSVYSYFLPMARPGPFIAGMQTRNEQAATALDLMNADLKRFIAEGPTAEELQKAVQNLTGGFALRIDSNQKLVEQLAVMGFYGLPLDYLDTFNDRVRAVTVESIHDAFRRRVDSSRMVTVTVGGG